MRELNAEGQRVVSDLSHRYGVSGDAVTTLLRALVAGNGSMAQFSHPELGGMGQWSQGGMIMVGDMFNQGLKARVDGLCSELANALRGQNLFAAPSSAQAQSQGGSSLFVQGGSFSWWPAELGQPSSTGAQNDVRYAFFPATRRLAIELGGRLTVYDTGDHQIGGVSQQQGSGASLTFTSQYGLVRVADLPVVRDRRGRSASSRLAVGAARQCSAGATRQRRPTAAMPSSDDVIDKIERLAALRQKGILTDEEFAAKKAELLEPAVGSGLSPRTRSARRAWPAGCACRRAGHRCRAG